jgi:hypothetical protein
MQNKTHNMVDFKPYDIDIRSFYSDATKLMNYYRPILDFSEEDISSVRLFLKTIHRQVSQIDNDDSNVPIPYYAEQLQDINSLIVKVLRTTYRQAVDTFPNNINITAIYDQNYLIITKLSVLQNEIVSICTSNHNLSNKSRLAYLQLLNLLLPVLELSCYFNMHVAMLCTSSDSNTALDFYELMVNYRLSLYEVFTTYRTLEQQRFEAKHLQPFWIDTWETIHPILHENQLCVGLEEIKNLSKYWLFVVDGNTEIRVRKASMIKYSDSYNQVGYSDGFHHPKIKCLENFDLENVRPYNIYLYKNDDKVWYALIDNHGHRINLPVETLPNIDSDAMLLPVLNSDSPMLGLSNIQQEQLFLEISKKHGIKKTTLKETTLCGFQARNSDPTHTIWSLAELLNDSSLVAMEERYKIISSDTNQIQFYLKRKLNDPSLVKFNILKKSQQTPIESWTTGEMKFLAKAFFDLALDEKNSLLIDAAKTYKLDWFFFYLEHGADISARTSSGEDILMIALDAPNNDVRHKILKQVVTSAKDKLLQSSGLVSDKVSKFRAPNTQNTLLHEVILLKIAVSNFMEAYFTLNTELPLDKLVFVRNNNGETIKDLAKRLKKPKLVDIIEKYQQLLFSRALNDKNLPFIKHYVADGGDVNILVNGQHPLEIIWCYLKASDKSALPMLTYLIANGCDITLPVCDGKTIGEAIRLELRKSVHRSFFREKQNDCRDALLLIMQYENKGNVRPFRQQIYDDYLLEWHKPEFEFNFDELLNFALMAYSNKIIEDLEPDINDAYFFCLLFVIKMLSILIPETIQHDNLDEDTNTLSVRAVNF